ncbi:MAG TPA: RNA polymerase sigma factor [Steroidobacteraceae bacterium]|jgi:RNA polymerase sigma factor (sigma-70 family)|nr:RNA polymerase sigma factor [Steroidobacteraceae bacterium]
MAHARFLSTQALADAELVQAARRGDATSLGVLFYRYRPRLLGLAMSLLGYQAAAEDAVHDTYVTALTHLDDLQDAAAVGGWLHATLRNRCLMERRRAMRRPTANATASLEAIPDERRVEDSIEGTQLREWVWNAIGQLPEGTRAAMLLRYFGSFGSYEEIAGILAIPVGTVRSRLFDGKARLAELLLAAAGVAADDQRSLEEERRAFFFESMQETFKHRRCDAYFEAHAPDLEINWSGKRTTYGREHLQRQIERDFDDGVVMSPQRVLASGNVSVLEGQFRNPVHDPEHCPPALALVMFHDGGQITRMNLYLSPRPPEDRDRD